MRCWKMELGKNEHEEFLPYFICSKASQCVGLGGPNWPSDQKQFIRSETDIGAWQCCSTNTKIYPNSEKCSRLFWASSSKWKNKLEQHTNFKFSKFYKERGWSGVGGDKIYFYLHNSTIFIVIGMSCTIPQWGVRKRRTASCRNLLTKTSLVLHRKFEAKSTRLQPNRKDCYPRLGKVSWAGYALAN